MLPLQGPLGPLVPEYPSEFIVGIVLMVLIYFVVRRWVSPAFEKMYEERADAIEGGIRRAERAQTEAETARQVYQAQLAEAHAEAAALRDQARAQADAAAAQLRDQARREAERLIVEAREQIAAERAEAASQLRTELGGLATTLAGRIVEESLTDDERTKRVVDRFLTELSSMPAKVESKPS